MARTLDLAGRTVTKYVIDYLGMNYRDLRRVPDMLPPNQKAKRARLAGSMMASLRKHASHDIHYIFTGDESSMFYSYPHTHQCVASLDDRKEIVRETHFQEKRMVTVFFNGTDQYSIEIMPKCAKMNGPYFWEKIVLPLFLKYFPQGRKRHRRPMTGHFDNPPIQGTDSVFETLNTHDLERMENPPYNPDLDIMTSSSLVVSRRK
jgi:hypothetical protein